MVVVGFHVGIYFHFQVMARMHERINEMRVKLSEMELNLLESRIEFNKNSRNSKRNDAKKFNTVV